MRTSLQSDFFSSLQQQFRLLGLMCGKLCGWYWVVMDCCLSFKRVNAARSGTTAFHCGQIRLQNILSMQMPGKTAAWYVDKPAITPAQFQILMLSFETIQTMHQRMQTAAW